MLLRRRDAVVEDEAVVEREEHVWGSPPVVRGLTTLIGVAAAGFLVWLATQFDLGTTGEYWSAMGILAGAGACLGLSQLIGGWTKWGAPTISPGVFLLAFLPTLIAVGGILVATRPTGTEEGEDVAGWISDIGLGGVAEDLILFQGVLAFGLGIVFAFMFDTRGPRARVVEERDAIVPDEEVHDYRSDDEVVTDEGTVVREEGVPAATVREERTIVEERDTRS
jgi:hypothetical protein